MFSLGELGVLLFKGGEFRPYILQLGCEVFAGLGLTVKMKPSVDDAIACYGERDLLWLAKRVIASSAR